MTTGKFGALLRRPGQAQPAFLELFFDLVFVLAFLRLSEELLAHLSWTGAFQTLVLLLPVLAVWVSTARFLDAFDPQHPLVQLMIMPIMFGTLVMAAATPEAFGHKGLVFAGAYLTVRAGGLAVAIFFCVATRHSPARCGCCSGSAWLRCHGSRERSYPAGRVEPLWITAAAVEYAGIALGFPTPRLGRSGERRLEVVVSEEHTAERYQQFFIIALGEPIVVVGLTFGSRRVRGRPQRRDPTGVRHHGTAVAHLHPPRRSTAGGRHRGDQQPTPRCGPDDLLPRDHDRRHRRHRRRRRTRHQAPARTPGPGLDRRHPRRTRPVPRRTSHLRVRGVRPRVPTPRDRRTRPPRPHPSDEAGTAARGSHHRRPHPRRRRRSRRGPHPKIPIRAPSPPG